ncbi:MAG: Rieske 2Fe-2S domain-containing protein [Chitinivibrionales bacterium]|nr:Rieske 2Fe-2S domain-containing protein [Chitinivibrionales bacterium]
MEQEKCSRREFFLKTATFAAGTTVAAPLLAKKFQAMAGSAKPMASIMVEISKPEYSALSKIGGAVKLPNPLDEKRPIIVVRTTDTTVAAYSSKCPHKGCEVDLPAENLIICPCHKATFDLAGKVIKGPTKNNLSVFDAVLENSIITIKKKST